MYTLWPFQRDAVTAVHEDFARGMRRLLVSMPTGTGKTIVMLACVVMALQAGYKCLIVVPSAELVKQTVDKLVSIGIMPGVVKQDRDEWDYDVVVAQFQTLGRRQRLARIPPERFRFVLIDEAHQSMAPTVRRIMRYFCTSWFIGFTASPFRGDRKSLALANWHNVSYVYTIDEAVRDGWLAKPRITKVKTNTNLDKAGTTRQASVFGVVKDFRSTSLAKLVNTDQRNEAIVRAFMGLPETDRGIAFCVNRDHAFHLANTFRRFGIPAGMVHYEMGASERMSILAAHREGELRVVTNVGVLILGYDDPYLKSVIMARPTLSKTLFIQMIGRGLRRPDHTKEYCDILDVMDTCARHRIAVTDEVFDLKHEIHSAKLGLISIFERTELLNKLNKIGIPEPLSERISFSDALTRDHFLAYDRAIREGRMTTEAVCQILGLAPARR